MSRNTVILLALTVVVLIIIGVTVTYFKVNADTCIVIRHFDRADAIYTRTAWEIVTLFPFINKGLCRHPVNSIYRVCDLTYIDCAALESMME